MAKTIMRETKEVLGAFSSEGTLDFALGEFDYGLYVSMGNNFDTAKMQVMIPDENKKFTRHYLDSITDLYMHKDELINALKIYL